MIAPAALLLAAAALVQAAENPYANFPSVPKTASINGFADPILGSVPECAKSCLTDNADTGSTPCPYWDTGCLCVMPQFGNKIADCIAKSCKGADVRTATDVAKNKCQEVGVWEPYWQIGDAQKKALDEAAKVEATTTEDNKPTETSQQQQQPTQTSEEPQPTTDNNNNQEQKTTQAPTSEEPKPTSQAPQSQSAEQQQGGEQQQSSAAEPSQQEQQAETSSYVVPSVDLANGAAAMGAGSLGVIAAAAMMML
ncbi:hypothetical protein DIURU_005191 [Diutina rugosa]|uniref:CFEM domain-containing protein n=1 Tax=Diutina rugosa TaxID=5481 RepID=A0A642UEJ9_DIURU|nr:uncharacterized protein DIURU_005191 [Diutina rugosa]KAA8897592.1 hypothetical protein DIURU_005191 [Diutina rugosa]